MNTPQLQSIEQVSAGWINKYELTYLLPNGSSIVYEAVSRKPLERFHDQLLRATSAESGDETSAHPAPTMPDAVSVVGVTPDENIVLIREFRYPINDWCLAFPAGLVEPGEDLRACVDRELYEETGYALVPGTDIRPLKQAGLSSTGLTDEAIRIVFAQVHKVGEPAPEPNEFIEVFEVPLNRMRRFLDENTLPIGQRAQLVLELFATTHPQND